MVELEICKCNHCIGFHFVFLFEGEGVGGGGTWSINDRIHIQETHTQPKSLSQS